MTDILDIINRIENTIYFTEDTNVNDLLRDAVDEIERLRNVLENVEQARVLQGKAIIDAANEIERLRAVLTHIYAWYPISVNQPRKTIDDIQNYARAALEGKHD